MFTGPVGPVEVFFYWPEAAFGNFYWPGAIGLPLASSPVNVGSFWKTRSAVWVDGSISIFWKYGLTLFMINKIIKTLAKN